MKLDTILDQIDMGAIALPEFQRGYVWTRPQVRALMDSLYQGHPVGGLLVWATAPESAATRGGDGLTPGVVRLLLDGQQRITSLYGIVRGEPPRFFDGNKNAFLDLWFHLEDETFEFYGPVKMKQDPHWISVTELMQRGVGDFFQRVSENSELADNIPLYMERMNRITAVRQRVFHIEEITGPDKTVDVVVDIFNRVNSGGTKLSKGDLALAKICAEWSDARSEMQERLAKWKEWGFHFRLDWFLRTINTTVTGEALFTALKDVTPEQFRHGLERAEKHVDYLLNLIGSRLGLDHDRVLGSRYAFPLLARYLEQREGKIPDAQERDRLLFWYVHTMLWGRYAGSTESVLNQDLAVIEENEGALDRLIGLLRQQRGDLTIHPNDFLGWSRGARFYPLLYMLSRVFGARDWGTGVEIKQMLLGKLSGLQLHHIFPKARLYEAGYPKAMVNSLANFTFLTQETNLAISDRDPHEYLPEIEKNFPGVLESHWIPMDPELWHIGRYPTFLEERRRLLSEAANRFLDFLYGGEVPHAEVLKVWPRPAPAVPLGGIDSEEERAELEGLNHWVEELGMPAGEVEYELADPETGAALAILDLAWPDGLQVGLSEPVAVLLNEPPEVEQLVNQHGFRFFISPESFRSYVTRMVLLNDAAD
ncbi:MAG: DUF262 domain-containing protein [Gemmatimonadota bacterium]